MKYGRLNECGRPIAVHDVSSYPGIWAPEKSPSLNVHDWLKFRIRRRPAPELPLSGPAELLDPASPELAVLVVLPLLPPLPSAISPEELPCPEDPVVLEAPLAELLEPPVAALPPPLELAGPDSPDDPEPPQLSAIPKTMAAASQATASARKGNLVLERFTGFRSQWRAGGVSVAK
jgi:hypothetical protein